MTATIEDRIAAAVRVWGACLSLGLLLVWALSRYPRQIETTDAATIATDGSMP